MPKTHAGGSYNGGVERVSRAPYVDGTKSVWEVIKGEWTMARGIGLLG